MEQVKNTDNKQIKKIFKNLALCILVIIFVITISPIALQNDTFYDIVLGERYLNHGMFTVDDYSMHEGLIYQTHHYAVTIITYLTYNQFSYIGLYVLEIVLTLIIAILLYITNKEFVKSKFLAYIFLFVELFLLSPFISVRAQMYSYIIFILEILLINRFVKTNKKRYATGFAILPMFLANFHSGTLLFYFIIIMVYILGTFKFSFVKIENDRDIIKKNVKALAFVAIIGLLLTVINPYGIKALTYGLKTINNDFINNNIQEFLPYTITNDLGIYAAIYVGTIIMCLILSEKKVKTTELMMFFGTTFMMLLSTRHISILIITSVILLPHIEDVYRNLKLALYKGLIKNGKQVMNITIYVILIVLYIKISGDMLLGINRSFNFVPYDKYPVEAVEYIKNNDIGNARIFNQYEWGSYLMMNNIKVFIDSRCDLYTEEYNKDTTVALDYIKMKDVKEDYNELVRKYNIEYFLIKKDSSLAKILLLDVKYNKIYEDNISCIIKYQKD